MGTKQKKKLITDNKNTKCDAEGVLGSRFKDKVSVKFIQKRMETKNIGYKIKKLKRKHSESHDKGNQNK